MIVLKTDSVETTKGEKSDIHRYQCPTCEKGYTWKSSLMRHIQYECGKEPQIVYCPFCFTKYKWKYDLERHIRLCGKEPDCQCPYCSYCTKHKSSLQRHVRTRHSLLIIK